jgi:hypothetical protein
MNRPVIFTILLLFLTVTSYAVLPDSFNNKGYYENLRFEDCDGNQFMLYNAYIGDGAIVSDSTIVDFDQITRLEYRSGSKWQAVTVATTCIGFVAGLVFSCALIADADDTIDFDDEDEVDAYTWPIYVGTAVGFIVGYPFLNIGQKYKTLYHEKKHAALNLDNVPQAVSLYFHYSKSDLSKKANKYVGISYRF